MSKINHAASSFIHPKENRMLRIHISILTILIFMNSLFAVILLLYYSFALWYALLLTPLLIATYLLLSFIVLTGLQFYESILLEHWLSKISIQLSHEQFPEVYKQVVLYSKRLGLSIVPKVFLLHADINELNAFVTKCLNQEHLVLYSRIMGLKDEQLSFVIGHELGHIKRKHISYLYNWKIESLIPTLLLFPLFIATITYSKMIIIFIIIFIIILRIYMVGYEWYSALHSRAREYSCDGIGARLTSLEAAGGALLSLSVGEELAEDISLAAYMQIVKKQQGWGPWLYEIIFSHPTNYHRILALQEENPHIGKEIL